MRILVTGGAGFLGSHLSNSLLNEGHSVVAIDDLSTGSIKNISHLLGNQNFQFIEHDVRSPIDLEVDSILNFACPASPRHYQANPVKTIETNFIGTANMLQLAKKFGARLVQASTSEIYGDPAITPQNESYWGNVNPIGPRSCYDEGKRAAETLCFDYKRQFDVDARVIRIFNTYGPLMAVGDGRVVSNFIVQALKGEPISIYGDGSQTRSFCYYSDLIRGITSVLQLENSSLSPINLGNPQEISMIELANKVLEITKSKSKIIFNDLPIDDPKQRKPDVTLAEKLIGWHPEVGIEEGLKFSVQYFETVI